MVYQPLYEIVTIYHPRGDGRSKRYHKIIESLNRLAVRMLFINVNNVGELKIKSDFQVIHARGMGMELTTRPFFFRGPLWRFICRHAARMNCGSKKSARFIRSIYESKRNWLVLPDSYEKECMEKHKKTMSREEELDDIAAFWIREAVDTVIPPPGSRFHEPYRSGTICPTHSACLQNSRKNGGNKSYCVVNRSIPLGFISMKENVSQEQFKTCYENREQHIVQYQSIAEPGKFRIITKGPGNLYTGVRGLQKYMLSRWKKMTFSTMKDNFEDVLHETMAGSFRNIRFIQRGKDPHYNSVDYSSATDYLKIQATQVAIERIIENLQLEEKFPELTQMVRECLSPAWILYPDGDVVLQRNGQLMGNPLSFPLLCIINLSCYLRLRGHRYDLHREKLFINGDDIVFQWDRGGFQTFIHHAGEVGLVVNKSKSYVHREYYLVNSILGYRNKTIGYYNRALAIGHRVKTEPMRMLSQARIIQKELLDGPPEEQKFAMTLFLKSLDQKIKDNFKGRFRPNYFIPPELGGLGLMNLTGRNVGLTESQRKIASYFSQHPYETIISEAVGDKFSSVTKALEKFRKIRPHLVPFETYGPIPKERFYDPENDMIRCLASTMWEEDTIIEQDYLIKKFYWKALKSNVPCMTEQKILSFSLHRLVLSPAIISKTFTMRAGELL
jgi:hypothetical protein